MKTFIYIVMYFILLEQTYALGSIYDIQDGDAFWVYPADPSNNASHLSEMTRAKVIYHAGINSDLDTQLFSATKLADKLGSPVKMIYNQPNEFLVGDLVTALSHKNGNSRTRASYKIEMELRHSLDHKIDTYIFAHSDGTSAAVSAFSDLSRDYASIFANGKEFNKFHAVLMGSPLNENDDRLDKLSMLGADIKFVNAPNDGIPGWAGGNNKYIGTSLYSSFTAFHSADLYIDSLMPYITNPIVTLTDSARSHGGLPRALIALTELDLLYSTLEDQGKLNEFSNDPSTRLSQVNSELSTIPNDPFLSFRDLLRDISDDTPEPTPDTTASQTQSISTPKADPHPPSTESIQPLPTNVVIYSSQCASQLEEIALHKQVIVIKNPKYAERPFREPKTILVEESDKDHGDRFLAAMAIALDCERRLIDAERQKLISKYGPSGEFIKIIIDSPVDKVFSRYLIGKPN